MNEWVQIAGWVLVHFLWQGSLVAIVAATGLRFCRRRSSNIRYIVACFALAAMLAAPLLTAFMLASQLSHRRHSGPRRPLLMLAAPSQHGRGTLEVFRTAQEALAKTARVSAHRSLLSSHRLCVARRSRRPAAAYISRLVSDSTPSQCGARLDALVVAAASEPPRTTTGFAKRPCGSWSSVPSTSRRSLDGSDR